MIKGLNDENRRSLPSLLIRCASDFYWFNKEVLDYDCGYQPIVGVLKR